MQMNNPIQQETHYLKDLDLSQHGQASDRMDHKEEFIRRFLKLKIISLIVNLLFRIITVAF
jgi:hypothetical protein